MSEIVIVETEKHIAWKFQYKDKWYGTAIERTDSLTKERVIEIGERNRDKIIEKIEKEKLYG